MSCSGIILCGGRGERVGGADKGLLDYRGRPLAEHVLSRLKPQVDEIVISANRNLDRYREFGFSVVADGFEGYQGPLAGVAAALPHCRHDRVILTACDTPNLPDDLAHRLLAMLGDHDVSHAWDGSRDQYLVAALRADLAASLAEYLASGQRSVRGWYASLRCARVDFSDQPAAFTNVNRLDSEA